MKLEIKPLNYNLSFTAGALLYAETKEYLAAIPDFEKYKKKKELPDFSVIPTNSESSKKRLKAEIDKRLETLSVEYLENFSSLSVKDQKAILFLAFCKSYPILTEFVMEVVYEKWKIFDFDLSTYHFEYFLNEKLSDEKRDSITEKTQYKLAQVAIKTLKEVGIIKKAEIQSVVPSRELANILKKQNDLWFLNCLLITNPNQLL